MPGPGPSAPQDASDEAVRARSDSAGGRAQAGKVLWEGVIVAVVGALFAFAANAVSPRGLTLARNYFPGSVPSRLPSVNVTPLPPSTDVTNIARATVVNPVAARLQARGLQLVESSQAAQLFRDPRYEQELVVFIDARADQHYQEGHIPGAYQFNHYRAENYLATVLPVCQTAEQIVVYCTGGDCEDSEFAALFLRDVGIPQEKLFVYSAGMTEWSTSGLPVEMGARKSGNFRPAQP